MNSSVMQFQERAWDAPEEEECGSSWNATTHYSEESSIYRTSCQDKSHTFSQRNNWNTREQSYQKSSYHSSSTNHSKDGSNRQNRRNRYGNGEQRSDNTYRRNEHSDRYQNTSESAPAKSKYISNERREYNRTDQNLKTRYGNNERQSQDYSGQSNYINRYSNNERRDYNRGNKQGWNNKFDDIRTGEKTYLRNSFEGGEGAEYNNVEKIEQRNRFGDGEREKLYDDKIDIMVPVSTIGRIIGRQGSRIRSLEETSQARIQIQNANTSNENNEVSVTITGSESAREKAKELINEVINQDYTNKPQQNNYSRETKQEAMHVKEHQKYENNQTSEGPAGKINWAEIIAFSMEERKRRWEGLPPIKKDFYFEDPDISRMSVDTVAAFRQEQNDITVQCLDEDDNRCIPNPITNFVQAFKKYPGIIREIEKQKFEQPSPIQCQAWPILLQGHDMIGIAQTGTGKTLAFLLPAFIHIDSQVTPREERRGPSCLIFAPTRELAQQIEREANKYSYKDIKCVCLYGGGSRKEQIQTVSRGVEVVIATPGRLNDLVMNNFLDVSSVTYLVLDEADRMLDMGFEPQIKKVLLDIRPDRQTVMTSATWPEGVRRMASQYMTKPMLVFIGSLDIRAVHSVKQEVLFVDPDEKKSVLYDFISSMQPEDKVIVFVDKKLVADDLASDLLLNGIECQSIHGDREQCDREQALEDLRTGLAHILVATDVASRGLDIKDITHIFNFDFPRNIEEYVHRVGRTGRAGQTGSSITLMTRNDWSKSQPLIDIMEEAGQEIPQELYEMAERYKAWKEKKDAEDFSSRRGGRQGGRFNRRRQDDWI